MHNYIICQVMFADIYYIPLKHAIFYGILTVDYNTQQLGGHIMSIIERIKNLRALMDEAQIDAYLIPSSDFHQSEYVGDYFKCREYITGFTGSAGTALITPSEALLWTDGRYFLQAETQLEGTGITLMRMGDSSVPTICEYLKLTLSTNATLGLDGRVISLSDGQQYQKIIDILSGTIVYNLDFIDRIWKNRPSLASEPTFHLAENYTGESAKSKLERIRSQMTSYSATSHILTSLDDICWLFNFRGNDVKYSPLSLGYAIIYMNEVELFIDETKLDTHTRHDLEENNVTILPYNDIYDRATTFGHDDSILLDSKRINYALYHNIPTTATIIDQVDPSILMKAMKNEIELENIRQAHIKDGVAVTKFMYWLKNAITNGDSLTELLVSDQLVRFRKEQDGFLQPSFAPICGYRAHAAIVHYEATEETNATLQPEHLLLMDTGGNYYEGSTDITRTFALGPLAEVESTHFTLVVRSMLALANTTFIHGIRGHQLDVLARMPFWQAGLDYNHGTGHGVGYLLNIHEGPSSISWRTAKDVGVPLEEGMVLTDEPGLYISGSHGIRIENELIVRRGNKNAYGQFMYFEPVTFVPIDLDAVNANLMSQQEKDWLNTYHKRVQELIGPHLTEDEQKWLAHYTRAI